MGIHKHHRRVIVFIGVGIVAVGVYGFWAGEDTTAARASVAAFRQQMTNGEFESIYSSMDPEFREFSSEESAVAWFQAISERLGGVVKSRLTNWEAHSGSDGSTVTLRYRTTFEHGSGEEEFVFRSVDGTATLMRYHISSKALEGMAAEPVFGV